MLNTVHTHVFLEQVHLVGLILCHHRVTLVHVIHILVEHSHTLIWDLTHVALRISSELVLHHLHVWHQMGWNVGVCLARYCHGLNLILTHHSGVVRVHKCLDVWKRLVYELCGLGRHNLLNLTQVIVPYILVPDLLKDFSGKLPSFVSKAMNEMTEISSCASSWPMVVSAWNCPIIARLYQLVGLGLLSLLLCLLLLFNFILLLELQDCIVCQLN